MRRIERRLFRITDRLALQRDAARLAREELGFHRHLHDDAARDAAVTDSPLDKEDARETGADVARLERHIATLEASIARLEQKRARLLAKLDQTHS